MKLDNNFLFIIKTRIFNLPTWATFSQKKEMKSKMENGDIMNQTAEQEVSSKKTEQFG
jgi:hypothetical protein